MKVRFTKSHLQGSVASPPSKSMAHRMLICGGLAKDGVSVIHGIADSDDVKATLSCLASLGIKTEKNGDTVTVYGRDITEIKGETVLDCHESGSTIRFFLPLCLLNNRKYTLTGSQKLLSRPLGVYENICREQHIVYRHGDDKVQVKGKLTPGFYKVPGNISSQFISGLLFALPLLAGDSTIAIVPPIESKSYLHLTVEALAAFGVQIAWQDEKTLFIKGNQQYKGTEVTVEGDYSNAAFFAALSKLGNDVTVTGLSQTSSQGDKAYEAFYELLDKGTPTVHIGDCPDLGPVLMAVAAAKNGAVFTGTRRLKIKESDRGAAMAEELQKFGVSVTVYDDSIVVYPATFHAPTEALSGHNDHRIVMALSVLLTLTGGMLDGAEAVRKSLPEFFTMLRSLGAEIVIDP